MKQWVWNILCNCAYKSHHPTTLSLNWQEESILVRFSIVDKSLLMAALKCCCRNVLFNCAYRSRLCATLLLHYLCPQRWQQKVSLSVFTLWMEDKFPLLSAAAAGELIHAPLGLHLTNLQSKPCKSIQLEVNGSASSCQLQTGLRPA